MGSTKVDTGTSVDVIERVSLQPPKMWNVVLYNDDKTTMEFVILVLMQIFHKNFDQARDITLHIHENGKGVAGTYSLEVASQKRDDTLAAARTNGFPLKVEIENSD